MKYIGESESLCLIKNKIYVCLDEGTGEFSIIDEESYDDEDTRGYLYPRRFLKL